LICACIAGVTTSPLPFIAVLDEKSPPARQNRIKKFTFGCREDIYRESVIIREKTDRMAKAVNNVYKEMYEGSTWHELDWFVQESSRASTDFIPAMLKLAKTNEKDAIANNALLHPPPNKSLKIVKGNEGEYKIFCPLGKCTIAGQTRIKDFSKPKLLLYNDSRS